MHRVFINFSIVFPSSIINEYMQGACKISIRKVITKNRLLLMGISGHPFSNYWVLMLERKSFSSKGRTSRVSPKLLFLLIRLQNWINIFIFLYMLCVINLGSILIVVFIKIIFCILKNWIVLLGKTNVQDIYKTCKTFFIY